MNFLQNGTLSTYEYDMANRLTEIEHSANGTPFYTIGYILNSAGNCLPRLCNLVALMKEMRWLRKAVHQQNPERQRRPRRPGHGKLHLWGGLGVSPAATLSTASTVHDMSGPSVTVDVDAVVASGAVTIAEGQSDFNQPPLTGHSYGEEPNTTYTGTITGPGPGAALGISLIAGGTVVFAFGDF